jgi:hypothetical protein
LVIQLTTAGSPWKARKPAQITMSEIKVGDRLPSATVRSVDMEELKTDELFAGKKAGVGIASTPLPR